MQYILSVDQSTSGTKAMLFDEAGALTGRFDLPHRQIINDLGWVEHDPSEIMENVVGAVRGLLEKTGVGALDIAAAGISNQRETAVAWDRMTGKPLCNAIVWQCGRAADICDRLERHADDIKRLSGLRLSPFFTAAKFAWMLENVEAVKAADANGTLCFGTVDSWLLFGLTGAHKTDYSNASRTQLFDIGKLRWSETLCGLFGIPTEALPEVCDSDSLFGYTDFCGLIPDPLPVHSVLGDSHGALFGHGCLDAGMMKATYGTGSSVMLNTGKNACCSDDGVVTSLAWKFGGEVSYVLEGNINYTGAVIKWLTEDVRLIASAKEAGALAKTAAETDTTYLVPAFTGLGAPHFKTNVKAALVGMSRTTGQAEIVRAAEECIAYQIADIIEIMKRTGGAAISQVNADGGPTSDTFLMQFQSDILDLPVCVSCTEELSGMGAAYMAGIRAGIYELQRLIDSRRLIEYTPQMDSVTRGKKLRGWSEAVASVLHSGT
jgi:glycerol kinase